MGKSKLRMEFDGFDVLAKQFQELEKDIEPIVEKALKKTHEYVTPKLEQGMSTHNKWRNTGETKKSLNKKDKVIHDGNIRYVNLGFDIPEGGLPTIFMMWGTPSQKPDKKLYNAIYGSKAKKEMNDIQADVFFEAMQEVMKS